MRWRPAERRLSIGHRERCPDRDFPWHQHRGGPAWRHVGHRADILGLGPGRRGPGLLPAAVENVAAAAAGLGRWVPQGAPRVPLLTSPARRCIETAQALRECGPGWMAASPEASIEPGLAEIDFGRWEGLSAGQAQARDPQAVGPVATRPASSRARR